MTPLVTLTRDPLQILKVDAIGYGAKDTGEMGGGAAAAVLAAAGPEILTDLRSKLARSPHTVGDVVLTGSFKLQAVGIRWVIHIISIIKHTPQGAYCPKPERLRDGVCAALVPASKVGARSVALSALGTGEGRVAPRDAARYMLDGVHAFRRSSAASDLAVTLSLPSYRDYEAFRSVVQSH
ncbi:MAG: macro domain-containing protein [Verrucomicrobia bacterium]|nr:macro domain-containing protein [Verrucomicrobiota bacterium]